MTAPSPETCPACGAPVSGMFCSACGAAAGPRICGGCRAPLSAQARFCHRCGQPAAAGGVKRRGSSERAAWMIAAIAITLLLGSIIWKVASGRTGAAVPDMANAGNSAPGTLTGADPGGTLPTGRAPDISHLSPAERFLRLNNRIMEAAARSDSTTVVNFTPMALEAYRQLDTVTSDERYHAAVLQAQVGQVAEARALADTMLVNVPGYLLAYVVRGEIAGFQGDSAAMRAAYAGFREHYATEMAARRAEYADHANVLDDFKRRALP